MTNEQMTRIKEMSASDGWKVFEKILKDHHDNLINQLVDSNDDNVRGIIKGIRYVTSKVAYAVKNAKQE